MQTEVLSADGVPISYERTGTGRTALVFVHGWLGSGRWWDAQRTTFSPRYSVVQLDLAGHGSSGRNRVRHAADAYARDIVAVVNEIDPERAVLVAHSMSGVYAALAAAELRRVVALVFVDTLKNVELVLPPEQVDAMLGLYRSDFRTAVERVLPAWLFGPATPPEVAQRLQREFLEREGTEAAALLEPLYRCDVRAACDRVTVPVRAISSDLQPTDIEANRRHFPDFSVRLLKGLGHYPMLEAPAAFDAALEEVLAELGLDGVADR